ncbi:MAG TPA: caspase family protein [Blastocatellia bacterium]|nr:caspase family protein [Blastocatellia bacterium]
MRLILIALLIGSFCGLPLPSMAQSQRGQGVRIKTETGQELDLYEESHALVIGVRNYTEGWPELPGAEKDVGAISDLLRKQGFQVTTLLSPTAAQLNDGLSAFISEHGLQERNRLLVYFAGHGHTEALADGRERGYIVPADAPLPQRNPQLFKRRALSMDDIEAKALNISSKHALFIFDSCFSGSIFESRGGRYVPPEIESKTASPVRMFITAGTKNQTVPDDSLFRLYFVRAFEQREGDLNGDGFITGEELGTYLAGRVATDSRDAQTPRYGKIKDARLNLGDIVFALPGRPLSMPSPRPVSGVDSAAIELALWQSADRSNDLAEYQEYLRQYPQGRFAALVRNRINKLSKDPAKAPVNAQTTQAQTLPFLGLWTGAWTFGENKQDATANFEPGTTDNTFTGSIVWVQRKSADTYRNLTTVGKAGTEYIRGVYDPIKRLLVFEGYQEDDPHGIISLEKYRVSFSEDGRFIEGKTHSNGSWQGVLILSRMK